MYGVYLIPFSGTYIFHAFFCGVRAGVRFALPLVLLRRCHRVLVVSTCCKILRLIMRELQLARLFRLDDCRLRGRVDHRCIDEENHISWDVRRIFVWTKPQDLHRVFHSFHVQLCFRVQLCLACTFLCHVDYFLSLVLGLRLIYLNSTHQYHIFRRPISSIEISYIEALARSVALRWSGDCRNNRMEPAEIRQGLGMLRDLALQEERHDVHAACCAIINLPDNILRARQHEIEGLKCLGIDPLKSGYFEAAVRVRQRSSPNKTRPRRDTQRAHTLTDR